jgi:phage terminase large subunit-like protein
MARKKKQPAVELSRADKVILFIETYCLTPEGNDVGKPFHLADFEIDFIRAVYDNPAGTRRAYLTMARKNGKTSFIACLLLVHLVGSEAVQNSQIISGAQSREQAALIYAAASKIVNLNPALKGIVHQNDSKKQLIGLPMNVTYHASSSEAKTAHGKSGVLIILDEIGQVVGSQDDFIDALITSQGAYDNPLLIAISTQAASDSDLFSIWLDDAAKGEDPHTISHVYAADKDCRLDDEEQWRKANPALGLFRSIEDVRQQAEQAKRMPSFENTFRLLTLNQRVSTSSPFISRTAWDDCAGEVIALGECDEVYGGLDLSSKTDLTALLLIGRRHGEKWNTYPYFWTPEKGLIDRSKRDRAPYDVWVRAGHITATTGATVDYEQVAMQLADICAGINLVTIAYDRWRIEILKKELERIGLELPLSDWGQGFKDMSPALEALEGMILNKTLVHTKNPVLNMCAANSITVKDPAGNRKLDKQKASGRIDGFLALAMAAGVAERNHEKTGTLSDFINSPLIL